VIGPPTSRRVVLVRAFLLAAVLGAAPALAGIDQEFLAEAEGRAGPDRQPPTVVMLPSAMTSDDQAVVIRALVTDDSGVESVTFWMKDAAGSEYRPIKMIRARDGAYLTWFAASDERRVRFYVEAWDRLGNGPGQSGSREHPLHVRALEVAREGEVGAKTTLLLASLVLLLNVFVLRLMLRKDRAQRLHKFWYRLLAPLVYKRGADLLRAVDKILAWMRRQSTPAGQEIERIEILRQLGRLHEARRQRIRDARKERRARPAPAVELRRARAAAVPRKTQRAV
jgi:hypothetical protein